MQMPKWRSDEGSIRVAPAPTQCRRQGRAGQCSKQCSNNEVHNAVQFSIQCSNSALHSAFQCSKKCCTVKYTVQCRSAHSAPGKHSVHCEVYIVAPKGCMFTVCYIKLPYCLGMLSYQGLHSEVSSAAGFALVYNIIK